MDQPNREAVLKAVDEFNSMGRETFMKTYDFADRGIIYEVVVDGRRYPSKAIFGVAHKYMPGGAALSRKTCNGRDAWQYLKKLGFEIVSKDTSSRVDEDDDESDADRIRRYVLRSYIEPARQSGEDTVEVLVRDVNNALSLNQAWPNICQVLAGRKFRELTGLRSPERVGPEASSATKFLFDMTSENSDFDSKSTSDFDSESGSGIHIARPTNTILYGPPGTGKTFKTADLAVRLCDGHSPSNRPELMQRYATLQDQKRIGFVTFHQSYDYETFIEGLRPQIGQEDAGTGGFRLEAEPGIFREICLLAEHALAPPIAEHAVDFSLEGRSFWKMSQGAVGDSFFDEAFAGHYIALGWGGAIDWSGSQFRSIEAIKSEYIKQHPSESNPAPSNWSQIYSFRSEMKIGDIVIVPYGNSAFQAVAEVIGDYRYERSAEGFAHRRRVKWLLVLNNPLPLDTIVEGNFTMRTLYSLPPRRINFPSLGRLLSNKAVAAAIGGSGAPPDQFVLIIDEINRGNISKIFGELITLLEPDKRLGMVNELKLTLPYSKTEFGVPSNLHIIGTMNTADRSIALLDTALRRRFTFEEIEPQPDKLVDLEEQTQVPLSRVLRALNDRIEYFVDREHRIGHAFFMTCHSREDVDAVMRDKVIPLLQEYFFEEWSRLAAVLGEDEHDNGHFLQCRKLYDPGGDGEPRFSWRLLQRFSDNAYSHLIEKRQNPNLA